MNKLSNNKACMLYDKSGSHIGSEIRNKILMSEFYPKINDKVQINNNPDILYVSKFVNVTQIEVSDSSNNKFYFSLRKNGRWIPIGIPVFDTYRKLILL